MDKMRKDQVRNYNKEKVHQPRFVTETREWMNLLHTAQLQDWRASITIMRARIPFIANKLFLRNQMLCYFQNSSNMLIAGWDVGLLGCSVESK